MGWQLFPTGVGWREFSSTPSSGSFVCPNARCKSVGESTLYKHKAGRNWFTVLFVPIIPLNRTGEWVKCERCKSLYPLHVLDRSSNANAVPHSSPPSAQATIAPAPFIAAVPATPYKHDPPVLHRSEPLTQPPAPLLTSSSAPVPTSQPMARHEPPPAVPPEALRIRFADGAEVPLDEVIVIGRDPSPTDDHPTARIHTVSDPTVSKTHLTVGRAGNDVWVIDNHSSNGVLIGGPSADLDRLPPGRRVLLLPGSTVSLGDSTSFVVAGRATW